MRMKGKAWVTLYAFFAIAVLLLSGLSPLSDGSAAADQAPATTGNPEISVTELQYPLKPLTKDDLIAEADDWRSVLKDHITKISGKQIQASRAEGDAKKQILQEVTKLQEQQTALIDRVRAVVDELRKKGGEVEGYEKYLTSLSF